MPASTTPESFWCKVDRRGPEDCWPWLGSVTVHGYGQQSVSGKQWGAHRYAYFLAEGSIPDGALICHTCDNRICCNPSHLYAGSHRDNVRDMDQRGRRVSHNAAKTHCREGHPLTEDNLVAGMLRYGRRQCLTCRRRVAREWMRDHRLKAET